MLPHAINIQINIPPSEERKYKDSNSYRGPHHLSTAEHPSKGNQYVSLLHDPDYAPPKLPDYEHIIPPPLPPYERAIPPPLPPYKGAKEIVAGHSDYSSPKPCLLYTSPSQRDS